MELLNNCSVVRDITQFFLRLKAFYNQLNWKKLVKRIELEKKINISPNTIVDSWHTTRPQNPPRYSRFEMKKALYVITYSKKILDRIELEKKEK